MTSRKLDLQKVTLNLFSGDMDRLRALHPDLEPSVVVRQLVHDHIARIEAEVPMPPLEITTPE